MSARKDVEVAVQPAELRKWVDALADQFEQAWANLTPPSIPAFLGQAAGTSRAALLEELILLDLEWRARIGARRTKQDYRDDFPELARLATVPPSLLSSSTATRAGQVTIPGYEDLEEIGRGGMGVVYKARQIGLNRTVALKMILSGAHADAEELTRFRLEAEAVARLEHPHIVQVHAIGELNENPFLSLEYVEGGTLDQHLAHTPQPPAEAAAMVEKLSRAMHAAHQRGIIHRDLKPANILLTKTGEPKISDFGLAKRLDGDPGNTCSGAIIGTACYMAPEQARGQSRQIGPAADVYALGAILYEMLIGRPPFKGATSLETIEQVCCQDPVPPRRLQPRVSRDLETICLKCLRKEPANRYASAEELADDLHRFLRGKPIEARPVKPWEHAGKWIKRNKTRTALVVMALLLILGVFSSVRHARNQQEFNSATHAADLVNSLASAETTDVPDIVDKLSAYRRWADPLLYRRLAATSPDSKEHLHLRMALVPVSDGQVDYLLQRLLVARPEELLTIRIALEQHQEAVKDRLWTVLENRYAEPGKRVRAACALATYDKHCGRWESVRREVAFGLVTDHALALSQGKEALRPIKQLLIDPMLEVFRDSKRGESERSAAFSLLADYAVENADVLAELDKDADDLQHTILLPLLSLHRERIIALMRQELHKEMPPIPDVEERGRLARHQARAAVQLVQLGQSEPVWPLLRHTSDPSLRTCLLHDLGRRGTEAEVLICRLETEADTSARRALVLCLGELTGEQLSPAQRQRLLPLLLRWYRDDPDAGVHGAVDWLLRHGEQGNSPRKLDWQQRGVLERYDQEIASPPSGKRNWYVTPRERLTMTVVRDPEEFIVGTPFSRPEEKNQNEYPHRVKIPRSFAIATKEVTVALFREFLDDNPKVKKRHEYQQERSPVADGPIIGVTWFQAAQFCNWLSKREGITKSEWCYPDLEELDYGMILPRDYLQRQGYRLPTEAEWEYACRAGAVTPRFFGSSEEMLKEYAWYAKTSNTRTFPVGQLKPNDLGLFDVYGNAMEWCQDEGDFYPVTEGQVRLDTEEAALQVTRAQPRVLRGGSFFYLGRSVRSAFRDYYRPDAGILYVGVRPARTVR